MTLYRNTKEEFGEPGPWEAASREELADGMQETFEQWAADYYLYARDLAREQGTVEEFDSEWARAEFIDKTILEMREEFIVALEEVVMCTGCGQYAQKEEMIYSDHADNYSGTVWHCRECAKKCNLLEEVES